MMNLKKSFNDCLAFASNKICILRLDLNLPIVDGQFSDFTRLEKVLPTLNSLIEENGKIIIVSHAGRPKGFDNKNFVSSTAQLDANSPELYFYHNNTQNLSSAAGVIVPPNKLNLDFNQFVYLEIDKYNTSDEIKPFINDRLNNTNTGLVNSYFAKIPIRFKSDGVNQSLSCKEDFIDSLSYYQPTIEKISKFKIKLRYHNGILADLGNYNISLTLEINQIRNEMKNYNVRTPFKF